MPSNSSVKVTGLNELNSFFTRMPNAFNTIFSQTTSKYAKIIYGQQNSKVPVKTGRLKRSIGTAMAPRKMELFVDAPYAKFINFGTRWMPARPFFTQPADKNLPAMIKEIDTEFGMWIKSNLKLS